MKRFEIIVFMLLVLLFSFAGCNIFSFTSPDNSELDYVEEGKEHLRDGEYAEALESFNKALEENPHNADALWGRAKARIRATGNTTIGLIAEMSQLNIGGINDPGDDVVMPFMDDGLPPVLRHEWPPYRINPLYQALYGVKDDIGVIYSGEAHSEELEPDDILLDYVCAQALLGIISLRDTNRDSSINGNDINLYALLRPPGGVLDILRWNSLESTEQDSIILYSVISLNESIIAITSLGDDVSGVDVEQLDDVVGSVSDDLVNDFYNGDDFYGDHPNVPRPSGDN